MKIIMIYDQIQSGLGTKDDTMVPLTGKKEPIGPAVMMEPFLKQVDGHVIACLCCGNGTYLADPEEVSRKLCAMVACDINANTDAKAFAAMSVENAETIAAYKDKVAIVETPKKGGMGLNDALKNMCAMAKALADREDITGLKNAFCFK